LQLILIEEAKEDKLIKGRERELWETPCKKKKKNKWKGTISFKLGNICEE
jgi:hypothetical protein